MQSIWNKEVIREELSKGVSDVTAFLGAIDIESLNSSNGNQWSIADETMHLVKSGQVLRKILLQPPFILKRYGTPNREIRTYDQVVERFHEKQKNIGTLKAPKVFVQLAENNSTPDQIINQLEKSYKTVSQALMFWSEKRMNNSLIPHPLFGRLISREMLYFVIFHNAYHLKSMKNKLEQIQK